MLLIYVEAFVREKLGSRSDVLLVVAKMQQARPVTAAKMQIFQKLTGFLRDAPCRIWSNSAPLPPPPPPDGGALRSPTGFSPGFWKKNAVESHQSRQKPVPVAAATKHSMLFSRLAKQQSFYDIDIWIPGTNPLSDLSEKIAPASTCQRSGRTHVDDWRGWGDISWDRWWGRHTSW